MDYGSVVRQHFRAPRGAGVSAPGVWRFVSGEAEDRTLNVWVRFRVEMADGVIGEARIEVYGCPHTIAAASCVAERLPGSEPGALRAVDARELLRTVAAPIEKLGKLLLIEDALARCAEQVEGGGAAFKEERV